MKRTIALFSLILFTSCASNQPTNQSAFDANTVNKTLVKNKTTEDQVLSVFGGPNITTQNADGTDVWVYSKDSTQTDDKNIGAGVVGFFTDSWLLAGVDGNMGSTTRSSKSISLKLNFSKNKILTDYTIIRSQF